MNANIRDMGFINFGTDFDTDVVLSYDIVFARFGSNKKDGISIVKRFDINVFNFFMDIIEKYNYPIERYCKNGIPYRDERGKEVNIITDKACTIECLNIGAMYLSKGE